MMGDIIYSGLLINRVHKDITEKEVIAYFKDQLKIDEKFIRYGGLKVKIYKRNGGTTRALVIGVKMSFDDIRKVCLYKPLMMNRIVQITNVVRYNCINLSFNINIDRYNLIVNLFA